MDDFFFVTENHGTLEASCIWHDRFSLRQATDGSLLAPKFLQPGRLADPQYWQKRSIPAEPGHLTLGSNRAGTIIGF